MDSKPRCQSCGMPLGTAGFYGVNADGSEHTDYCKFCWQHGTYTKPDMTLEDMIASSITFMTAHLKFSPKETEKMSREIIPQLKRWHL